MEVWIVLHGCKTFRVDSKATTLAHELSDDIDGLFGHDGVELHQLVVPQPFHDLSLLQESLRGHGPWLQSLHCHLGGAVPHA